MLKQSLFLYQTNEKGRNNDFLKKLPRSSRIVSAV